MTCPSPATLDLCRRVLLDRYRDRPEFVAHEIAEIDAAIASNTRAAPLLFLSRPHPTRPFRVWTFGTAGNEDQVEYGSTLDLGLCTLQMAVAARGERVDISLLDGNPLQDAPARTIEGFLVIKSRAFDRIADRHEQLARLLRRVSFRSDLTACYCPEPGDPEILTDDDEMPMK